MVRKDPVLKTVLSAKPKTIRDFIQIGHLDCHSLSFFKCFFSPTSLSFKAKFHDQTEFSMIQSLLLKEEMAQSSLIYMQVCNRMTALSEDLL